ncbi:MAG: four helix bundle protein [Akkermansiaceae bacterium]
MEIYQITKSFSPEECFALTSQIRRSSWSVTMNLQEAWAKRRYEAHFISKLTDCDGEKSETDTSLDFAKDCANLTLETHQALTETNRSNARSHAQAAREVGPQTLPSAFHLPPSDLPHAHRL